MEVLIRLTCGIGFPKGSDCRLQATVNTKTKKKKERQLRRQAEVGALVVMSSIQTVFSRGISDAVTYCFRGLSISVGQLVTEPERSTPPQAIIEELFDHR